MSAYTNFPFNFPTRHPERSEGSTRKAEVGPPANVRITNIDPFCP